MLKRMAGPRNTIFVLSLLFAAALAAPCFSLAEETGPRVVKNPYATVNWESVNHYKANLHSHTLYSDGRAEPDELIYNYANAGYHILALTDHDNHHTTRDGERETEPTVESTWPWTNWIPERPSVVWHRAGSETAAFYPDLGEQGMLAVRGNELSSHPHTVSLFSNCGFADRDQTEEERMKCVGDRHGLSYWAHPVLYVPEGGWEDRFFDESWEEALDYYGRYIVEYDHLLGFEMQAGDRRELEEEFLNRLLDAYYRDHDFYFMGSDDTHSTSVSDGAVLTIVLAEDLTEEALRQALKAGHKFVGAHVDVHPQFNSITVDEDANTITVDVEHYDTIAWFVDGKPHNDGSSIDYSEMEDAIVRFQVHVGEATFYSQAFYIN